MPGKRFTAEKIINMLREAKVLVERWRREYNHIRPHSSLGYGLLPRRLSPRWERRYSAPLHLMPTRRGPTLEVVQSMEACHNIKKGY